MEILVQVNGVRFYEIELKKTKQNDNIEITIDANEKAEME